MCLFGTFWLWCSCATSFRRCSSSWYQMVRASRPIEVLEHLIGYSDGWIVIISLLPSLVLKSNEYMVSLLAATVCASLHHKHTLYTTRSEPYSQNTDYGRFNFICQKTQKTKLFKLFYNQQSPDPTPLKNRPKLVRKSENLRNLTKTYALTVGKFHLNSVNFYSR